MTTSPASTACEDDRFPVRDETRVRVPASSANVGPGFDSLGIALDMWLYITVRRAKTWSVVCEGRDSAVINTGSNTNTVCQQFVQTVTKRLGLSLREPFEFHVRNEIPVGKGLGSSAAAIVGGIAAAYSMAGFDLADAKVLAQIAEQAGKAEGHPDNVVAAIYGGVRLCVYGDELGPLTSLTVPFPYSELCFLLHIPNEPFATHAARSLLPESYQRSVCVRNASKLALLLAVLSQRGPYEHLKLALADEMHEPFRRAVCPSFDTLKAEADQNPHLLGVYLSGAGPTSVIICRAAEVSAVQAELNRSHPLLAISGAFMPCRPVEAVHLVW